MNNLSFLLADPIVLFSAGGLVTLLAIGTFYVFYFLKKMNNNEQEFIVTASLSRLVD